MRRTLLAVASIALSVVSAGCGASLPAPAAPTVRITYPPLMVQPKTVTLSVNEAKCFTATGGDGQYSWKLTSNSGRGVLKPHADQACFQADGYAAFVITVSSGDGQHDTTSGVVIP